MSARILQTATGVTASGVPTGTTINMSGATAAFSMQALTITVTAGTVTALSAVIEASLDGVTYTPISNPITNVAGGTVSVSTQFPWPFVRANVTSLTGTAQVITVVIGAGRYFQG